MLTKNKMFDFIKQYQKNSCDQPINLEEILPIPMKLR